MWTLHFLIVGLVIIVQFIGTSGVNQKICAYKNDSFKFNSTDDSQFDSKLLGLGTHTQGQFVKGDYEYCPISEGTGTSHCYILWGDSNDGPDQPIVIKQGCWIKGNLPGGCDLDHCDYTTSTSAITKELKFCCCTGNKCNDLTRTSKKQQTEAPPATKTVMETALLQNNHGKANRRMLCAFKTPASIQGKQSSTEKDMGQIQPDGETIQCHNENDVCFSYYQLDPINKSKISVEYQGCWNNVDLLLQCEPNVCIPKNNHYSSSQNNNSHFCCCSGDLCNNNLSTVVIYNIRNKTEPSGPTVINLADPSYKERTIVISLVSVFSLAIIILAVYLVYRYCFHPLPMQSTNNNNLEIPDSPTFDVEDLKISCSITKGRYSEVWHGSLNEQDVAVKIYSPIYKQYYYNEKYIYSLPHMEHENVLKFMGGGEKLMPDGNTEYLLVLQYVPMGTLMNYLKNNTIDWNLMCKMCQSLARGLSHLHTDIGIGDNFKPTVAHRDLNSRNVLVKNDLSCIIADLGFCKTTMGSKLIMKGHTENAEQTSLTDVGTLRYMAPELLDGAVNLRDCEASLKQIDMYAFGLVMWEISSRCSDLYQGCPMPEFALPYHAEADSHPSFEEMQLLVSRNKVRPKFPEVWKEYNPAVRALKETIEECWDHDAEARLTALCVEERILEMKTLWSNDSRNKANKGVTPTINTALLSNMSAGNRHIYHGNGHTQLGGLSSSGDSTLPNIVSEGNTSALIINDIRNTAGTRETTANWETSMSHSESTSLPPTWTGERRGSFSTSTMETTLGNTPASEIPPPSHPKSQNINAKMNQPVMANQGRNAIVERNTHKRSDEELAVVGNNLFYGKERTEMEVVPHGDNIFDSFTDSLESSLMQNDTLNHGRSPPGTYTQNQQNLNIGAGHNELPPKVINSQHGNNITGQNFNGSGPQKNLKKGKDGLLGQIAWFSKRAFGAHKFESRKNDLESPMMMENGRVYDSVGRQNPMFEPTQSCETEVRLTNTGIVVRPTNIQTKPCNVRTMDLMSETQRHSADIDSIDSSEADLQSDSPLISRHRVAPYSKSTSDLSPEKLNGYSKLEDDESKLSRPSTLSLKGHNYNKASTSSLNSLSKFKSRGIQKASRIGANKKSLMNGYRNMENGTETQELMDKPKEKVGKHARFSLHDDRLMSDNARPNENSEDWKSSVSLQQFDCIDEHVPQMTDCTC